MAYISKRCVECTEPTKRECGEYHGTDEKGKYSGPLYECDNRSCEIYYYARKSKSQASFITASKPMREHSENKKYKRS